VVGRGLDEGPVAERDAEDRFAAVCLRGDDSSCPACVVHLAADLVVLDELADRDHAFGRRDQRVVWLARAALRFFLKTHVEPDRAVEGRVLVDEDRLQLVLEGLSLLLVREVAAVTAPRADGRDDAADHLLHARLAVGRAHAAAEVLLRDDVRGRLRPELRELDALLLEDRLLLARDQRVAQLPLDLLERIASGDREVAPDGDVLRAVYDFVRDLVDGLCGLRGRHSSTSWS
jgi:hypothetical protein